MAAARTKPLRPQFTNLLEQFAPDGRVDKANGWIRGVKLIGRKSFNTHDIDGASRTEYTVEALQRGAALYEGADVYRGHAKKDEPDLDPNGDRDPAEKIGLIENVRYDPAGAENGDDGLRGDLHLFNTGAEFSTTLLNAPTAFCCSHNANGRWELRGDTAVIVEIRRVRSVDIVSKGGSTRNLFESHKGRRMSQTYLQAMTKFLPRHAKGLTALLEMGEMGGTMLPPDAPAEGDADAGAVGYEDHISKAVCALFSDPEVKPEEKKRKIIALLKITEEDVAGAQDDDADIEEDEEDDTGGEGEGDGNPFAKKGDEMKESLKLKKQLAAFERREQIRDLCESEKVSLSKQTVEDLAALQDLDAARRLIATLQESADPMRRPPKSKLRGQPAAEEVTEVTADDLVAALPG